MIRIRKCRECSFPPLNGHMVESTFTALNSVLALACFSLLAVHLEVFCLLKPQVTCLFGNLQQVELYVFFPSYSFTFPALTSHLIAEHTACSTRLSPAPSPDKNKLAGRNFCTTTSFQLPVFTRPFSLPSPWRKDELQWYYNMPMSTYCCRRSRITNLLTTNSDFPEEHLTKASLAL